MPAITRLLKANVIALGLLLCVTTCSPNDQADPRLAAHTIHPTDEIFALAHQAHFDSLVHLFAWREIEPTRNQFHWHQPDFILSAADYYGFTVIARLDQHPAWASEVEVAINAPPDDLEEYRRFVERVVSRYRGRIPAYIIWNEPNLAIEWGGQRPDPAAFTELLRVGYEAVKASDPQALVVAAGLAPTNSRDETALDERVFLRQMYQAGAGDYFDVLAAHPYSFGQAPTAPAQDDEHPAFSRLAELRAIMVEHGDAAKPVWITEMGWTVNPPPEQADIEVTLDQQANYLVEALAIIQRDWPWVELITVWNLSHLEPTNPFEGYSLLGQETTLRPAFTAWQAAVAQQGRQSSPLGQMADSDEIQILATDTWIHLGDSNLQPPWWPLYGGRQPSLQWTGGFYMPAAGQTDWTLWLEVMQQNEIGATVAINGVRLRPDLPPQDFTRRWLTVRRTVPSTALRSGYNEISVTTVRLLPDAQHDEFVWDDFQVRHIRLTN